MDTMDTLESNDHMLDEKLQGAIDTFATGEFQRRHKGAENEETTKRYLIEPYLKEVLGIDPGNPDQVGHETKAEGYKEGHADYVFKHEGRIWCVVETKKLGPLGAKGAEVLKGHWDQLKHYADSKTFEDVEYFVLTDGRLWWWFRRDLGKYLPELPFLKHDVSAPTEEAITWYKALRKLSGALVMEDLAKASQQTIYAATAKAWLSGLKSPNKETLDNILELRAFKGLRGKGKYVKDEARSMLHEVWSAVYAAHVREANLEGDDDDGADLEVNGGNNADLEGDDDDGADLEVNGGNNVDPPTPRLPYAWRLGLDAEWNHAKTFTDVMVAVVAALSGLNPKGSANWYAALAEAKPKWINREGTEFGLKPWPRSGKEVGHGFLIETHLSTKMKLSRIRYFADDIDRRIAQDPQLEIRSFKKGGPSGAEVVFPHV